MGSQVKSYYDNLKLGIAFGHEAVSKGLITKSRWVTLLIFEKILHMILLPLSIYLILTHKNK